MESVSVGYTESGQPVTRPTKWAKHRIKRIPGGRFASSEFGISTKPLRLEQQICENNAARIWIISIEYFWSICQLQPFQKDADCGWVFADMIALRP